MRLTVRHLTEHRYDPPAGRVALRLKLFPARTQAQTPRDWHVTVNGEAVAPALTNGFGDGEGQWFSGRGTDHVEVLAEGSVEATDTAGVVGRFGAAPAGVFLRQTPLTQVNADIRQLASVAEDGEPLARMHALSAAVHGALVYRPGVTRSDTSAAQALALGAGVCQDKTHLFIAAARAALVPARYVVGYLLDEAAPLQETHAWAEVHLQGLGWVGFDPTNQVCPTEHYVRLCSGLDADDAAPIRGSIQGASADHLSVSVEVAQGRTQQQSQQ